MTDAHWSPITLGQAGALGQAGVVASATLPPERPPVDAASTSPIEPIGLAQRAALPDGRELWRLPADDRGAAIALELLELGRRGIGGLASGGKDDRGPWLVRSPRKDSPIERGDAKPIEDPEQVRPILALILALARALASAETASIEPDLIGPRTVWLDGDRPWLDAQAWVHARVEAPLVHAGGSQPLSREWLTPEAAEGLAEDAASNRYRLALLLYRSLAGQGPFAGLGLRSAIDRLRAGVPPLPDAIARLLPPGLHATLLRWLDPDRSQRPTSAAAMVDELARFVDRDVVSAPTGPTQTAPRAGAGLDPHASARAALLDRRASVAQGRDEPREATPRPEPPVVRSRRSMRALPIVLLLAIVAAGVGLGRGLLELGPPDANQPAKQPPPEVGVREPLDLAHTSPDDCASCHPRQTAEWKRSVMGHSAKSPLFQALEILIEEQVGRSDACPGGAGILRNADPRTACRNPETNIPITGSGGALWCVNCHTPRENLAKVLPAWDGLSFASSTRLPLRDIQPESTTEGIDCGFCHQVHGPVQIGAERVGGYEGNPSWFSSLTGNVFSMRPEDRAGVPGISNSGYQLDPGELLATAPERSGRTHELVPGGVHRRPSDEARAYLSSSQFCGACHDVRLFGSDALATPSKAEHFRRLRNAYSEWLDWTVLERNAGREPADCQDCHMSSFPGVCVPGEPTAVAPGSTIPSALLRGCPPGTRFESRSPGERPELRVAAGSPEVHEVTTHYFSGVDIPLTPEFDDSFIDQPTLDAAGIPLGGDQRRDLLLGRSFRFELGEARVTGRELELPIELENTGAGHKVPAGFSQEREFWVHLRITDARGQIVYEVGRVDRNDEDLRDKIFARVNVDDRSRDAQGRPLGMFGADIVDGPDHPEWTPEPASDGTTSFRGRGLINLQNGFLRCVRCIGFIDERGECQPADRSQALHRAARFVDGELDDETGECRSNLLGEAALFETYFPVGSLDASRGVVKGPDAIIDSRSASPGVPLRWTFALLLPRTIEGPLKIEARLLFRAFPPFLLRAFAEYERLQAARGLRPSGALVSADMLDKLEVVEIARVERSLDVPGSKGRR